MRNKSLNYTYTKPYTQCFDYAFLFFVIFSAIKESQLDAFQGLKVIVYPSLILSVGFSLLSIFRNVKWNVFRGIAFVFLFFIPLYLRLQYTSNVLVSSMLILAAYNIPFSHIAKMCIKGVLIASIIILLALFLGVIEDRLYYRDVDAFQDGYAHDLGFKYYSFYSYLGMGVVQCCIYLWRRRLVILRILFLATFSYVVFLLSSTRLQLYTCVAFISVIVLLPHIPKWLLDSKVLATIAVIAYPLICLILYYVSKYSILSLFYDNYAELNQAMNGRLRLNEEAFMRYDVTLWGNDLEFNTMNHSATYFYIDSGYLHVLFGDGLVFTSFILILYSILTYKVFQARAYYLYLWLLIYVVLNISNGFLFNLLANPILLLAFSDTTSIQNDYFIPRTKGFKII